MGLYIPYMGVFHGFIFEISQFKCRLLQCEALLVQSLALGMPFPLGGCHFGKKSPSDIGLEMRKNLLF